MLSFHCLERMTREIILTLCYLKNASWSCFTSQCCLNNKNQWSRRGKEANDSSLARLAILSSPLRETRGKIPLIPQGVYIVSDTFTRERTTSVQDTSSSSLHQRIRRSRIDLSMRARSSTSHSLILFTFLFPLFPILESTRLYVKLDHLMGMVIFSLNLSDIRQVLLLQLQNMLDTSPDFPDFILAFVLVRSFKGNRKSVNRRRNVFWEILLDFS